MPNQTSSSTSRACAVSSGDRDAGRENANLQVQTTRDDDKVETGGTMPHDAPVMANSSRRSSGNALEGAIGNRIRQGHDDLSLAHVDVRAPVGLLPPVQEHERQSQRQGQQGSSSVSRQQASRQGHRDTPPPPHSPAMSPAVPPCLLPLADADDGPIGAVFALWEKLEVPDAALPGAFLPTPAAVGFDEGH